VSDTPDSEEQDEGYLVPGKTLAETLEERADYCESETYLGKAKAYRKSAELARRHEGELERRATYVQQQANAMEEVAEELEYQNGLLAELVSILSEARSLGSTSEVIHDRVEEQVEEREGRR